MSRLTKSIAAHWRAPFAPAHRFASLLAGLVILRVVMVVLLMADVPHLNNHVPPWFFHTGGDQQNYFILARDLSEGQITDEKVSLGSSLLMVPFVWLFRATQYRDLVAPLVIFNGLLLGSASVALTGLIGKHYTGDERVGLLGAAAWLSLPIVIYVAIGIHPAAEMLRGSLLPKIMWLTGISDGPASFGILVSVLALGMGRVRDDRLAYFVAGLGFGWAVMYRIQVAPAVAFVLGLLVLARAWRGLAWVSLGGLIGYLPQAVLNTITYGLPFYTGYLRSLDPFNPVPRRPLPQLLRELPYSPAALVNSFAFFFERYAWLAPALAMVAAIGLLVFVALWRKRDWFFASVLLGLPAFYVMVNVSVYFFQSDPVRFSMLAYPYLLVAGAFLVFLVWDARTAGVAERRDSTQPATVVGDSGLKSS